ncbi:Cilia- and flagella-associated protein 100 [Cichlidogyrus casuarinus]|uniref:Cilia- and flagella-associated protein 100 n=1 Tax=Cichlidogyrus casuarinus TaxID=1844966 RepID=A0ABD2QG89_9PLAT
MNRIAVNQERDRQRNLKVHEKIPVSQTSIFRREALRLGEKEESQLLRKARAKSKTKNDYAKLVLEATKSNPFEIIFLFLDRPLDREPLEDYINKKREMFMVQYSISIKKSEIKHLEGIAATEEKKLEVAEQCLEQDAALFDEFLKENDRNSVEAIALAEQQTKKRIHLNDEIKQLNSQILQIKADINRYEEKLKDYKVYGQFLEELVPEPQKSERRSKREQRKLNKRKERKNLEEEELNKQIAKYTAKAPKLPELNFESTRSASRSGSTDVTLSEDEDFDSEPELFFKEPDEVLDLFTELEEANLSLIQNCQEAEENLEQMKHAIRKMKTVAIVDFGDQNVEEQRAFLDEIHGTVKKIYMECIHSDAETLTTIQMLTEIEDRMENLFKALEMLPQDEVEAAQREKEMERRSKAREEKKLQQKLQQEDRIRKALERAKAAPKKQTGRRIMERSKPTVVCISNEDKTEKYSKEDEELAYFFT